MKGLVLAAGKGSRLYPMTLPVCKPLLPVYDKPMIYYPVCVLMQAGIREILVILPPGEEGPFERLLGDGSQWGVHIEYVVQYNPRGIADAFNIGAPFIGDDPVCLVLGDNIFHSLSFERQLVRAGRRVERGETGATVFGFYVDDPRAFGVIEFDENGKAISIEEKPRKPRSNYIVPGLYFYSNEVVEIARHLTPSARGELEITDVNLEFLRRGRLTVEKLDRDFLWLDAGTADNLLHAGQAVRDSQEMTGRYIGCPEEIAYNRGYIDVAHVHAMGRQLSQTLYGQYLLCL